MLASNLSYFSAPKDLKVQKPVITKLVAVSEQGYSITLTSDKLVKDLYLDTDERECSAIIILIFFPEKR